MDIPAPLTYGTVVGKFITVLPDSNDAGTVPDAQTLSGNVTITPKLTQFRIVGPPVQLVVTTAVTGYIVNGDLYADQAGSRPLVLLASDSPGIDPSPAGYNAKFNLTGVGTQPAPVDFLVPSGGTVDLGAVIGLPIAPPVQTVVSEETRIAAEAAAVSAAASAATINTKVSAVSLSQSAYNALTTPDPTTLYLITS